MLQQEEEESLEGNSLDLSTTICFHLRTWVRLLRRKSREVVAGTWMQI